MLSGDECEPLHIEAVTQIYLFFVVPKGATLGRCLSGRLEDIGNTDRIAARTPGMPCSLSNA